MTMGPAGTAGERHWDCQPGALAAFACNPDGRPVLSATMLFFQEQGMNTRSTPAKSPAGDPSAQTAWVTCHMPHMCTHAALHVPQLKPYHKPVANRSNVEALLWLLGCHSCTCCTASLAQAWGEVRLNWQQCCTSMAPVARVSEELVALISM